MLGLDRVLQEAGRAANPDAVLASMGIRSPFLALQAARLQEVTSGLAHSNPHFQARSAGRVDRLALADSVR